MQAHPCTRPEGRRRTARYAPTNAAKTAKNRDSQENTKTATRRQSENNEAANQQTKNPRAHNPPKNPTKDRHPHAANKKRMPHQNTGNPPQPNPPRLRPRTPMTGAGTPPKEAPEQIPDAPAPRATPRTLQAPQRKVKRRKTEINPRHANQKPNRAPPKRDRQQNREQSTKHK
ncbi:hypothetical protein SAMN02745178_00020 [Gemmiger formicilis]|uniref:Uncharacterized protein n=1 Tax=Gemmiger formicilis TaxID=745368 RepID=A0A1T4W6G4_9FIRM|nr:hypothetical protein SAMN02745178_00020 [Gemmiger formicilis]